MDYRYVKYINDSCYYTRPTNINEGMINLDFIPTNYTKMTGDHWTNISNYNQSLPEQGWKIHISTQLKTAKKTLSSVAELMFNEGVSFKYVKSMHELMLKDSKYGDRSSSGKFITIYPSSTEQFVDLLYKLKEKLSYLPKGPYILNDKRWYDSNIYFRYGGFMPKTFYHDGEVLDAIVDPNGNLIEDQRKPFYSIPDFIEEPKPIKRMEEETKKEYEKTCIDNYDIKEALHFSNGGGVYLANHEKWGEVILKEGRPHTASDFDDIDAFKRLENEGEILKKLKMAQYPVGIYEDFIAWEHKFIVEEHIQGNSLSIWIVNNYPFSSNKKNDMYVKSSINILNELINSIEEIHSFGIGFGDLQPANIMITPDEKVRLIDFETAGPLNGPIASVMTPGFIGDPNMCKEQSDWFAVLRIAKQMFVPIGNVQDISHKLDEVHNSWVEKVFGTEALKIIKKIEVICDKYSSLPMKEFIKSDETSIRDFNLVSIKEKLVNSIKSDLYSEESLIHGDIRQYEMDSGKLNVLTGGFGVIMAVKRAGEWDEKFNEWIENLADSRLMNLEDGLYTGKMGIANVLIETDYKERAKKLIETIDIESNIHDISIASGLSGLGLGFLGIYYEFGEEDYLNKCKKIGELLEKNLENDIPIHTFDYDIVDKGFLTSWSGASLFMSSLYKATDNKKWLTISEQMLDKELEKTLFDEDGLFQTDDDFRILPYLSSGGSGLAIPIIQLQNIRYSNKWIKELEGIAKISHSKTFYNAGLFQGTTGILSISHLLDSYLDRRDLVNSSLFTLNLHLIETKDSVYVPGDSCFRISSDLMSGSAGLLTVIHDIMNGSHYSWLPLLNINRFINLDSLKKEVNTNE
ncbi:class III lanthionine synthetase LanKC [Staphylococcus sp. SQ8-PEA]|uniref:Class III lanthionine synthetase LanKC n=1 Tax=Staphylococcus marylandisciuri TaxID=2981529 RepID=A0ABT2QSX1_9STAP|nr:class III lanthionine synthetase LanKC [Staphylococcus marylandisciuri]MCU5747090.1 class III lanthionine synthetase LanKC [Staphylococcus marylandisciuri]